MFVEKGKRETRKMIMFILSWYFIYSLAWYLIYTLAIEHERQKMSNENQWEIYDRDRERKKEQI